MFREGTNIAAELRAEEPQKVLQRLVLHCPLKKTFDYKYRHLREISRLLPETVLTSI